MLKKADMFITTGLDLEMWAPTVLDKAGNRTILEGGPGYVTAVTGIKLLEVPEGALSRSEGDIHVYGNPHITTDPLNMILAARNILAGMKKVDPRRAELYEENTKAFEDVIHRRLFGDWLVDRLGGDTLARLARSGRLLSFLEEKEFQGERLIERLGGWMAKAAPLRGRRLICYHKNWSYLMARFGLDGVGYVETKPGIPPTPQHAKKIIRLIEDQEIHVIMAANYFDSKKPQAIADKTGARVVVVPLMTAGSPGLEAYEDLVDHWIDSLLEAFGV
jgi:ABC-type Zn uptake system ZnuABC Zn-binding protein ZnuA